MRGRGGRPGHLHPGGRLPQDPRRRATRSTGPGSTPRATRSPTQAAGEARVRAPTSSATRSSSRPCTRSSNEADLPALARELEVGEPTLHDIFEALARPDRDPRDDLPKPIFKKGVLKLEDLSAGMELKGTVLNVVDFGAFVDIGLKDSGLVHISQLANRYIKSPHDVVSVGDVVTVWVMGVDNERKRVSLTMVKPGTERPRGAAAAAGGGGASRPRRRRSRRGRGPRPAAATVAAAAVPPASRGAAPASRPRPAGGRPCRRGTGGPPRGGPRTGGTASPAPRAAAAPAAAAGPAATGPGGQGGGGPGRFERPPRPPAAPAREAGPAAAAAVEGRPRGQRPAPHLRPAQAALAGPHDPSRR